MDTIRWVVSNWIRAAHFWIEHLKRWLENAGTYSQPNILYRLIVNVRRAEPGSMDEKNVQRTSSIMPRYLVLLMFKLDLYLWMQLLTNRAACFSHLSWMPPFWRWIELVLLLLLWGAEKDLRQTRLWTVVRSSSESTNQNTYRRLWRHFWECISEMCSSESAVYYTCVPRELFDLLWSTRYQRRSGSSVEVIFLNISDK